MACQPCWYQRQMLMAAWQQRNPIGVVRAVGQGVAVATDKLRGIDVNRKYGGASLAQDSGRPRPRDRVR